MQPLSTKSGSGLKFVTAKGKEKHPLLVLPFWEGGKEAADLSSYRPFLKAPLSDFKGKIGETLLCYADAERLLLLGLGQPKELSAEVLRRAYANAVSVAQNKGLENIALLPPKVDLPEAMRAIGEGLLLANYAFHKMKGDSLKKGTFSLLKEVAWIGVGSSALKVLDPYVKLAHSVYFTRDLVHGNADDVTPRMLAETARSFSSKVRISLFDKKKLESKKMGLILAVARGSCNEPYLIQATYRGAPKSKEHVILVGKGVTYDTGGLSLKPTDNMLTMKSDMAGGAAVLGVVRAAAELGKKVNVTALVPAVENAIGSRAYKPGDVYRSYSGKWVEIKNTDAEGRLILADALSFAVQELKPSCVVDLATLTGAIVIALGEEIAGLFTPDDSLAKDLLAAGEATGEVLWRMPLNPDCKESLKSDEGDLINTGGREGSSMKAALFLEEFVGKVPWAHIDMAGPGWIAKPKHYTPTHATGFGVRLLLDFVERRFR